MLRGLAIVVVSLLTTVTAAESLFRLLPVSTATMVGYYVDPDVMTYPPGHAWTVSTGWDLRNTQRLRANNWGFASDLDFVRDPRAVALIGDSFVEASMLDAPSRPARQLHDALGGTRPVYGLGSPGTALLDHAQRIRLASEKLGIRDFVVWVGVGNARQAVCGLGNIHSRCLDPSSLAPRIQRQAPAGPLKRIARHSALLQYVFGQLKVDGRTLMRALGTRQVPAESAGPGRAEGDKVDPTAGAEAQRHALTVVDAAVDVFFAEIAPYRQGRLVFVVDGRHGAKGPTRDPQRDRLIERLQAHQAEVIDLEPIYRQHAAHSPLSLEVGPYDAHLNALGVRLVVGQAAAMLRDEASVVGAARSRMHAER
jgi:hypothetical protein